MSEEFVQEHFLGCSIRGFNLNIGWGNTPTVLTVNLVEDDSLFERFEGQVGSLSKFQFKDWVFYGVLINFREIKSFSGNRTYEAILADPRELLSGVQVILGGYNGPTAQIPNLYNVYGYLENQEFGKSDLNNYGISANLALSSLNEIIRNNPIKLLYTPFFVDFTGLPQPPSDFRISNQNISLLELVQEICNAANFDFTVLLQGNIIYFRSINRNTTYLTGSIYESLAGLTEYSSLESGFELQYNSTGKFLVGAQVEEVFFQFNNPGNNLYSGRAVIDLGDRKEAYKKYNNPTIDDTIARFWGTKEDGSVIVSFRNSFTDETFKKDQTVNYINEIIELDGRSVSWPGVDLTVYKTDIIELRAVLESRDSWDWFIKCNSVFAKNWKGEPNIHYKKNEMLKLSPDVKLAEKFRKNPNLKNLSPKDLVEFKRNAYVNSKESEYIDRLYNFLYNYASEYLDKKYMVRIPFVSAFYEEKTDTIKTSLEPVDSGYIEEFYESKAVGLGLLPDYTEFLKNELNKIVPFARFGPFTKQQLDLSKLSEEDYYISGSYVFVKCQLDPKVYFVDRKLAFSPRVVITVPGPVYIESDDFLIEGVADDNQDEKISQEEKMAGGDLLLAEILRYFRILVDDDEDTKKRKIKQAQEAKDSYEDWKSSVGADLTFYTYPTVGVFPDMVAIPLKDNYKTYGPWYKNGINGKVEFEQDIELAPWNFNGYQGMNNAAQYIINNFSISNIISETGSFEVPGSPIYSISDQLTIGGPAITQIQCSIDDSGVKTTYRMERWNPNRETLTRFRIEQELENQSLRRTISKLQKEISKNRMQQSIGGKAVTRQGIASKDRKRVPRTTHQMIVSNATQNISGFNGFSGYQANVGSIPFYQVQNVMNYSNWEKLAGGTLDTIFCPFNTDTNPETKCMPYFGNLNYSGNGVITSDKINPFSSGNPFQVVFGGRGSGSHTDINDLKADEKYFRGMALRAPIIVAGWGYDTNGKPVPGSGYEFNKDYSNDISKWKVGPLDLRWDEDRQVWSHYQSRLFYTGISGITAAVKTNSGKKIQYGKGYCKPVKEYKQGNNWFSEVEDNQKDQEVFSTLTTEIEPNSFVQTKVMNGKLFVDTGDC